MQDPDRKQARILAGPPGNPELHMLNGAVSTPLFDHLGSSSWHSFDGSFIVSLGRPGEWPLLVLLVGYLGLTCFVGLVMWRITRRLWGKRPKVERL